MRVKHLLEIHRRRSPRRTAPVLLWVTLFLTIGSPPVTHAEDLWIDGPPRLTELTRSISKKAIADVEMAIGLSVPRPIKVIIAQSPAKFEQAVLNAGGGRVPSWALAVAVGRSTIIIKASSLEAYTSNDIHVTLRHELTHLALEDLSKKLPRWLEEGLCEFAADRVYTSDEQLRLARLARNGKLHRFAILRKAFPPHDTGSVNQSYLQSGGFVRWLSDNYGQNSIKKLLTLISTGGRDFEEAFEEIFGLYWEDAESVWAEDLSGKHSFWRELFSQWSVYTFMGILAVIAFIVSRFKRRRLLREMDEWENRENGPG